MQTLVQYERREGTGNVLLVAPDLTTVLSPVQDNELVHVGSEILTGNLGSSTVHVIAPDGTAESIELQAHPDGKMRGYGLAAANTTTIVGGLPDGTVGVFDLAGTLTRTLSWDAPPCVPGPRPALDPTGSRPVRSEVMCTTQLDAAVDDAADQLWFLITRPDRIGVLTAG